MADAKKCDECGDLYEMNTSPNVINPEYGAIRAIILQFRIGSDNVDLCAACKQGYAEDILRFYTEIE